MGKVALWQLAASAVLLAAGSTPARADVFVGDSAACAKRLASLEVLFREAETQPDTASFLPVSPGFDPPAMESEPAAGPFTAVVEVGPSGVLFDGRQVAAAATDAAALQGMMSRELESSQAAWRALHPGERSPRPKLGLWLDARGKAVDGWALVVGLSKTSDVYLLGLKTSGRPARQVPASASKQLQAIRAEANPTAKAALISRAAGQSVAGCAGHERHLSATKGAAPLTLSSLRGAVLSAIKGCSCKGADLDLVEALTVPELAVATVAQRAVPPNEKTGASVSVARSATVRDLFAQLPPSGPFSVRWQSKK